MRTAKPVNLLCGRPLTFGDKEQIKLIQKADDLFNGVLPVAEPIMAYSDDDLSFDDADDIEEEESYEMGEYFRFRCIRLSCKQKLKFYTKDHTLYFRQGDQYQCDACESHYQVGEDLKLYHVPTLTN